LPAHAVLFFSASDVRTQQFLIRANSPSEAEVKSVYNVLHEIAGNAIGSIYSGILAVDAAQITQRILKPNASIERIVEVLERAGHLQYIRGMATDERARIQFTATRNRLNEVQFKSGSPGLKRTIDALLRGVDREAFEREVFLDAKALLERHAIDAAEFKTAIRTMEGLGLLRYVDPIRGKNSKTTFHLNLLTERVPLQYLEFGAKELETRLEANLERLDRMVRYATQWECRRDAILNYFGERSAKRNCGTCDVCIARSRG